MRTFWALPLRHQLLLANLLLFLIPVLALGIWHSLATLRERQEDLIHDAQRIADSTAGYVNDDLEYLSELADDLVTHPAVRRLDPLEAQQLLTHTLSARRAVSAFVLTSGGRRIAAAGDVPDLQAQLWPSDPDAPTWLYARGGAGPAGALVLGSPVTRRPGEVVGTVSIVVATQRLNAALQQLTVPEGSVAVISDAEGRVLAQNLPPDRDAVALLRPRATPEAGPLQAVLVEGGDGVDRFQVASAIPDGPWTLTVAVPQSIARARAVATLTRSLAVLALGTLGCVLGAWLLARRLGGSLSHLDAAAKRIAAGDFAPLPPAPMRAAEFADLQAAFSRMLEQFNTTRGTLDTQMAEERRIRQALESLQGQVIRQERLAAVGQLVSGVAHEINNPLQAILGFAELLQLQQDVPDTVKADLKLIQKESARACNIIRNLALFARQQPGEAGAVRMRDVIRAIAELRQRRLEAEDIELYVEDRAEHPVTAVLTELQQVALNFTVNAEQAIIGSGRLPGRITLRTYDEQERVIFEVEDTGPGVPAEHEAKLFQPFFTTKPVGQGTGLGLSISYGIIESLGGSIGHRRAPAGGAIFYFALPRRTQRHEHGSLPRE